MTQESTAPVLRDEMGSAALLGAGCDAVSRRWVVQGGAARGQRAALVWSEKLGTPSSDARMAEHSLVDPHQLGERLEHRARDVIIYALHKRLRDLKDLHVSDRNGAAPDERAADLLLHVGAPGLQESSCKRLARRLFLRWIAYFPRRGHSGAHFLARFQDRDVACGFPCVRGQK